MHGHRLTRTARALSEERGFTLTELLVGMVAGLLVTGGLFSILSVTLHQTTRTFSRVDATQKARVALETIENEIHSGCYANAVTPIVSGSTGSSINFWTQYGSAVNLTPTKHTITYDSAGAKLTDTTFTTSGSSPNWVAGTPSVTKTLLANVAQSGSTPVFQYNALTSTGPTSISTSPSGLTDTDAHRVAQIRITLVAKPADGSNLRSDVAPDTVTNDVTLRLTPIPNPSPQAQEFDPCE